VERFPSSAAAEMLASPKAKSPKTHIDDEEPVLEPNVVMSASVSIGAFVAVKRAPTGGTTGAIQPDITTRHNSNATTAILLIAVASFRVVILSSLSYRNDVCLIPYV